jgi:hypothetical protein
MVKVSFSRDDESDNCAMKLAEDYKKYIDDNCILREWDPRTVTLPVIW